MKAKVIVALAAAVGGLPEGTQAETLQFRAVCDSAFDSQGVSEDNDFARWTPTFDLKMQVNNPALIGKLKQGDRCYVTITPVNTTYGERMIAEHTELLEKAIKLTTFLESGQAVPDEDRALLIAQSDAMREYLNILELRIDRYQQPVGTDPAASDHEG